MSLNNVSSIGVTDQKVRILNRVFRAFTKERNSMVFRPSVEKECSFLMYAEGEAVSKKGR